MSKYATNISSGSDSPKLGTTSIRALRSTFQRLKIGYRIYLGFGLLLVMMTGLSFSSYFSMTNVEDKFTVSDEMNTDVFLVSDIRQGVDAIQKEVRSYFIQKDPKKRQRYEANYQTLTKTVGSLLERVEHKPEVKQTIQTIAKQLEVYNQGFERIAHLIDERDDLFEQKISPSSNKIQNGLTDIGETANLTGNILGSTVAGEAQSKLLAARMDITSYRYSHDNSLVETAEAKLETTADKLQDLGSFIKKPKQREKLEELQKVIVAYRADFKKLHALVSEIEATSHEVLDVEALKIAETSTQIRELAMNDKAAISKDATDAMHDARNALIIVGGFALLFGIAAAFVIARGIAKPVVKLTASMSSLADGDLTTEIEGTERGDELGEMAQALGIFKQNALRTKEMEAEQERQKQQAEQEKHEMMLQMADDFDSHVGVIVEAVSSASSQLHVTAQSMSEISDVTASQATAASAASEQTSSNVQTVASATEEMTTTIGEISEQVALAAQSAQDAVGKVDATNGQMQILAENASKIGEVVEIIAGIAEQTNLLALNATIEAARAGDSGKGFAVVAGEVKALAGQTAKATSEIAQQINAIQAATGQASHSMEDVNRVILQVNDISTSIAAAMEEQNTATHEIADNITQAAQGTQLVNENVVAVTEASTRTGVASNDVISAAVDLQSQAGTLKEEVNKFIIQVRAS